MRSGNNAISFSALRGYETKLKGNVSIAHSYVGSCKTSVGYPHGPIWGTLWGTLNIGLLLRIKLNMAEIYFRKLCYRL